MAYIYPAPGVAAKQMFLKLKDKNNVGGYTSQILLTVPALQDITINNAKDVFTWTQLDNSGKFNLPTTAANSVSGNLVLDPDTFWGDGTTDGPKDIGVFGLSDASILVEFEVYVGDDSDGNDGQYISGEGYITGLSPSVSADSPVWVSPFTITVTGSYTSATTAQVT